MARAILSSGQIVEGTPISITLNARTIEPNQTFNITYITKDDSSTGLESYELTVDVGNYFDESKIVWYVGTSAMKIGKDFYFAPIVANQYIVSVKLMLDNGTTRTISNTVTVHPKSVDTSSMLVFLLIAGAVLIVICILSIIISNKGREKIW